MRHSFVVGKQIIKIKQLSRCLGGLSKISGRFNVQRKLGKQKLVLLCINFRSHIVSTVDRSMSIIAESPCNLKGNDLSSSHLRDSKTFDCYQPGALPDVETFSKQRTRSCFELQSFQSHVQPESKVTEDKNFTEVLLKSEQVSSFYQELNPSNTTSTSPWQPIRTSQSTRENLKWESGCDISLQPFYPSMEWNLPIHFCPDTQIENIQSRTSQTPCNVSMAKYIMIMVFWYSCYLFHWLYGIVSLYAYIC